jgi:signal transduction histidine kinase
MNQPPAIPSPNRSDWPPEASAPPARCRRVLLVVDDEAGLRQSLRLIFERDYEVVLLADGAAALQLVGQRRVDAALVDINMAGMAGIDLLGRLKEQEPGLEVAILTGHASLETAKQAIRLGASDYVTKPFTVAAIRDSVARMMMRREVQEHTRQSLERLRGVETELAKLRDRGQIYGDVLHDINRPLSTIVGHLGLLTERLQRVATLDAAGLERLRERLESLNRQADNIAGIVHRYLGCLRQETGGVNLAAVDQVFEDLQALLKIYPEARNRSVHFRCPQTPLVARVNGTDLLQILLNLTVNALQASPAGGAVEIATTGQPAPLDLTLWHEGPDRRFLRAPEFCAGEPLVTLTVRDQGTGMPPELVGQLFDAPATRPNGAGIGLGLALVRRLVFLSAGALALHSQPGVGSCVWLFLPVPAGAAAPRPRDEPVRQKAAMKSLILRQASPRIWPCGSRCSVPMPRPGVLALRTSRGPADRRARTAAPDVPR